MFANLFELGSPSSKTSKRIKERLRLGYRLKWNRRKKQKHVALIRLRYICTYYIYNTSKVRPYSCMHACMRAMQAVLLQSHVGEEIKMVHVIGTLKREQENKQSPSPTNHSWALSWRPPPTINGATPNVYVRHVWARVKTTRWIFCSLGQSNTPHVHEGQLIHDKPTAFTWRLPNPFLLF